MTCVAPGNLAALNVTSQFATAILQVILANAKTPLVTCCPYPSTLQVHALHIMSCHFDTSTSYSSSRWVTSSAPPALARDVWCALHAVCALVRAPAHQPHLAIVHLVQVVHVLGAGRHHPPRLGAHDEAHEVEEVAALLHQRAAAVGVEAVPVVHLQATQCGNGQVT